MKKIYIIVLVFLISFTNLFAETNNFIKHTSKSYGFSFEHSNKYVNNYERYLLITNSLEYKERNEQFKKDITESCQTYYNVEPYSFLSPKECIEDALNMDKEMLLDYEDYYKKLLNSKIEPEELTHFKQEQKNEYNNFENVDVFSYFVKDLNEPIYYLFDYENEELVSSDGVVLQNKEGGPVTIESLLKFNSKQLKLFSYVYQEKGAFFSKTIGPTLRFVGDLANDLDSTTDQTEIEAYKLYLKNKNGISFYKIPIIQSSKFFNIYCTAKEKIICFGIHHNDRGYVNNEKEIIDPIIESFNYLGEKTKIIKTEEINKNITNKQNNLLVKDNFISEEKIIKKNNAKVEQNLEEKNDIPIKNEVVKNNSENNKEIITNENKSTKKSIFTRIIDFIINIFN